MADSGPLSPCASLGKGHGMHGQIEQWAEICPIFGIALFTRRSCPAARKVRSGVLIGPFRARLGVSGVLFVLFRARFGPTNRCVVTNRPVMYRFIKLFD